MIRLANPVVSRYWVWFFWYGILAGAMALACARASAQGAEEWVEWTHQWGQLSIVVRTNAGVFSPALQALAKNSSAMPEEIRPDSLMALTRTFFVMTSTPRVDHTFEFIEPLAKKWGPGHSLPILAAIALENAQRPMPTLFGGPISTMTEQMKPTTAGGIDPQRAGVLRIVIHGQQGSFRREADRVAHASAKAYYDANRNEVGLLLDMTLFRRFHANWDAMPQRHPATLSAFIAYAMDAFNDESGHELTHVHQQQTSRRAYAIPAIREGEAEVNGMVRRRDGLIFNFLYNTPEAWFRGRFDGEVIGHRVKVLHASGRPMHPREVERLTELKQLRKAGRALHVGTLLAMDSQAFFAGTVSDIESRYGQAWALCLHAIRDKQFAEGLAVAIDARIARAPKVDLEEELDQQYGRFIEDPHKLVVTKERAWADAERFFRIDPVFAGAFYAWIHQIDPTDMKALVYLGDALYKGRNLHAAMRYYEAARRVNSQSALPLLRIGDVLAGTGEREAALLSWRAAGESSGTGEEEVLYRRLANERPTRASSDTASEQLAATLKKALEPADPWLGFPQYPASRSLCSQRVIGTKGQILDWRSFATEDDVERVADFYAKQGLNPQGSGGDLIFRRGSEEALLLSSATNPKTPSCDRKPRATEKAVIVVSRMRRKPE